MPESLSYYQKEIGRAYSEVLSCKSVLNDIAGITGVLRKPNVELIYGNSNTTTIHNENKVKYKTDPAKVMFSSGNMDERIRMSKIVNNDETVVDLFAGIGYFTLPIAVHSQPKRIYACEKNPDSYKFLSENIALNNVLDIVKPLFGDNREVAPKNIADRVIMGYIDGTEKFLSLAIKCLKDKKGIIHFHEKYPLEKVPKYFNEFLKEKSKEFNVETKILNYHMVKSFAPKIGHYVFDIEVCGK